MLDGFFSPVAVLQNLSTQESRLNQKQFFAWMLWHKNFDKVIAYINKSRRGVGKSFSVVFERQGFAGWKLTEILMGEVL